MRNMRATAPLRWSESAEAPGAGRGDGIDDFVSFMEAFQLTLK